MSEKKINALEALDVGIVDRVVPFRRLEETAIQAARDFTRRSLRSLVGVKRLINYNLKDIEDYLEFESYELLKTINTM
jgi:enoyl-CoA hydratase/carnithine racemase